MNAGAAVATGTGLGAVLTRAIDTRLAGRAARACDWGWRRWALLALVFPVLLARGSVAGHAERGEGEQTKTGQAAAAEMGHDGAREGIEAVCFHASLPGE